PLLRCAPHHHVHPLYLAAGEVSVDSEVEAGEGEGGSNRGRRRTHVLSAVGVNYVLVDERGVGVSERVIRQLVHQGAALARCVGPSIRLQPEARPLQATARAHAHHLAESESKRSSRTATPGSRTAGPSGWRSGSESVILPVRSAAHRHRRAARGAGKAGCRTKVESDRRVAG